MAAILYKKLPGQKTFHEATDPIVFWSTGYGGGKTYGLVMKCFQLMNLNRGLSGGITTPNTKMYKKDILPTIEEIAEANGIRMLYNKSDMTWRFPGVGATVFVFHGEDEGRSIRGPNLAWMALNEVTLMDLKTIRAAIARVRHPKAKRRQIIASGTPEGFGAVYEEWVAKKSPNVRHIMSRSEDNLHIPKDYFEMLRSEYDPLMVEQYVEGKFVNLIGNRAFWNFSRDRHTRTDIVKQAGLPVLVSIDFNVDPMAATLWNRIPFGYVPQTRGPYGHYLHGFDEIKLRNSNTFEMCEEIQRRVNKTDEVIFYPDPSGVARRTTSPDLRSDIDIIQSYGFRDIRYKNRISVKQCLHAVNAAFSKNIIVINSKKCLETIKDLEQCVLKSGSEMDKSNHMRTHWADGLKNLVEYEFPIITTTTPRVSFERAF